MAVAREFVTRIIFDVTGDKDAAAASERIKSRLERVGKTGEQSGKTVSRSFSRIRQSVSSTARALRSFSSGVAAAGRTGSLAPLRRSIDGISAAALRARGNLLRMAAAGAKSGGRMIGRAAVSPYSGIYNAARHPVRTGRSVAGFATSAPGMLAGMAASLGAYQVKQTADEVMNLDGRLRAVTATDKERLQIEEQIYQVSQNNRQSMTAIGDLYTKVARAAKPMGYTNEQSMRVADIVSKALTAGGASTAESEATILQLGQALQAGVLQGDELASLRENGGTLMTHMAEAMGVTVADLKQMGAEGELTSQRVMDAILASGAVIDAEFEKMPMTIGQAMQKAENRFSRFILLVEQKTGVFSTIAKGIDSAFDELETYAGVMEQLRSGPQDGKEDAFAELQQQYPILNALANDVFPAISKWAGVIADTFSTLYGWWSALGMNQDFAELLSNVFSILQTIWDILQPIAELFGGSLLLGAKAFLTVLNVVLGVAKGIFDAVKSVVDYIAEKIQMIRDAMPDFMRLMSGDFNFSVPSAAGNADNRTQNYTFNVNSPDEVNAIMGGPVMPSLSPTV